MAKQSIWWNDRLSRYFYLRDYASDLQFLQTAKASGVKSETFIKEIDKQIARAVVDDDESINSINNEIDSSSSAIGQFSTTLPTDDNGEEA